MGHEILRLRRVASAVARQWSGSDGAAPARQALRTARLKATWPYLADALDHLVAACADLPVEEVEDQVLCPLCRSPLDRLIIAPNPRTAAIQHTVQPCGHVLDREEAIGLWEKGLSTDVVKLSATALVAAEQARQREEEGYSAESDAEHEPGALAWAAWCYADRATSTREFNDEVPTMWPLPIERWKPEGKTPTRLLIIASALLCSEIDARLKAGEAV